MHVEGQVQVIRYAVGEMDPALFYLIYQEKDTHSVKTVAVNVNLYRQMSHFRDIQKKLSFAVFLIRFQPSCCGLSGISFSIPA